jgi:rSAM/selenodomain-associated transferase 2
VIISIIVPVLNEATIVTNTLLSLQPFRQRGHEVIVVDGGSTDASVLLSRPLADQVIRSPRGRSRQMNVGAKAAKGEILLFLHADTILPKKADRMINEGVSAKKKVWGRFDVSLSGKNPLLCIIESLMNLRSRISGIATGDQGIFVRRELFERVGGFPDIDLMEDIALSRTLKKVGRPLCLRQRVLTSDRRWREKGILRTILLMWFLRGAYFCNANPRRLAKLYYPEGSL